MWTLAQRLWTFVSAFQVMLSSSYKTPPRLALEVMRKKGEESPAAGTNGGSRVLIEDDDAEGNALAVWKAMEAGRQDWDGFVMRFAGGITRGVDVLLGRKRP